MQILTEVAAMDDVQKVQGLESETGPHEPDELVMITPAKTFTKVRRRCEEEIGPHKPDELVTPVKTCIKVKYGEETGPHEPDALVM